MIDRQAGTTVPPPTPEGLASALQRNIHALLPLIKAIENGMESC